MLSPLCVRTTDQARPNTAVLGPEDRWPMLKCRASSFPAAAGKLAGSWSPGFFVKSTPVSAEEAFS